jgi:hypothetical protein
VEVKAGPDDDEEDSEATEGSEESFRGSSGILIDFEDVGALETEKDEDCECTDGD